jgi:phospholipid-binding lipoprotein MlaA
VRDVLGYTGDIFLDPINYLVFPSIELDGAPSAIPHTARTTTTAAQFGTRTEEIVNERSINLETFQGVEEGTVDLYGAVRNAYLQRRAKMVKE